MDTLAQALRLAPRLPVFPLREDKRPACPHGFKDATCDPDAVRELWRLYPGPLIGWPTGESSGIDVLDIDPRHGGAEWLAESTDALPLTRRHETRSGGCHLLFRHVKGVRNSASRVAPGVDVRGEGGFVVHWPAAALSVSNASVIAEWPRWLLKLVLPLPAKPPPPVPASQAEASTRAAQMINRAFDRVRAARPGQRHYELRAAAATLGGLLSHLHWSEAQLRDHLVQLVMATGAEDQRNAERTAEWALAKGRLSPLLPTARHV